MLTFSADPQRAEQQMHAIIFYLVTFGYIDGDFDAAEKSFVRSYIRKLVEHRAATQMTGVTPEVRAEAVAKYTRHFHEVFEGIDQRIKDLWSEPVSKDEDPRNFVDAKLKQRCFEIFKSFGRPDQEQLMATIDELIMADGTAHPAELQFRAELASLLGAEDDVVLVEIDEEVSSGRPSKIEVHAPQRLPRAPTTHPFFAGAELHYSADPQKISAQVSQDLQLVERVLGTLEQHRARGAGQLAGKGKVDQIPRGASFLDGHVFATMPRPNEAYELTVLGDLHGCYSVLKAALLQTRFFEKVEAYRKEPAKYPYPLLVLLGDYIDRGLFSLNGVLRLVLQLYAAAPDHVVPLRGNHEYYVEVKGNVYGGVKPAESINTLKPHLPVDVFKRYAHLFEELPNVLLFDRLFFVHGGIPRDRLLKERWTDLASLNDPDLRFQMMWSDPSTADVIPADLQEKTARFAFGRMQARAFLQRVGCHTLIRGHEKVNAGFERVYDDEGARLFTLFSAGGADNDDLPAESSYRTVTPMALTIRHQDGVSSVTPWAPDYKTYNAPEYNAFFAHPPEIPLRG